MSLYRTTKLTGVDSFYSQKKYFFSNKVSDYIHKINFNLTYIKHLKRGKITFRLILFVFEIYLCENLNDLLANLCINLITPKSIADNKKNILICILKNRFNSLKNLFLY